MQTSRSQSPVRRPFALVVVLAFGVAACAADADTSGAAVEISENQYEPSQVEVAAGESVTWTNADAVPHTVTFTDGSVESSDQLAEGESFATTFDSPGTYAYVCAVHPEMEATVSVTG